MHIKPQIERPLGTKTETAIRIGELVAREAQIEQDAVNGCEFELGKQFGQIGIVAVCQFDRQAAQHRLRSREGVWIAIEAQDQAFVVIDGEILEAPVIERLYRTIAAAESIGI